MKDYTRIPVDELASMQKLTELKWQKQYFVPLFLQLQWAGFHETDSRKSRMQSPFDDVPMAALDWFLIRERVVWAELKQNSGSVSKEQRATITLLEIAKQQVFVWKPRYWDRIVEELTREHAI